MNAPAPALDRLTLDTLPLNYIRPSTTPNQIRRRRRFTDAALAELAASIRTQGLLQPILVRAILPENDVCYEIVCGERRWLAAKRAGLLSLPANMGEFDDSAMIEAQLTENLQRVETDPIEEAEGYAELMRLKNIDAAAMGALIGKSESYVYARRKLLDLCPAGREALENGTIDASKALLAARFPSPKLQQRAIDILSGTDWRGHPISYRTAVALLQEKLTADLTEVRFIPNDSGYFQPDKRRGAKTDTHEPLPACILCPHNSHNDPELQADLKADANVCTAPDCYALKTEQHIERELKAAIDAGKTVVTGDDARKLLPRYGNTPQYVDLDAQCHDDEYPEPEPKDEQSPAHELWFEQAANYDPRTYRQLLGAAVADQIVLAQDPNDKRLHELVPIERAAEVLRQQHNIILPSRAAAPSVDYAEQRRKQQERQDKETAYRTRILTAVFAKATGPLVRRDLVDLCGDLLENIGHDSPLPALYDNKRLVPADLTDTELARCIRMCLVEAAVSPYHSPQPLLDLAVRYKIDTVALRKVPKAAPEKVAKAAKKAAKKARP